MDYNNNHIYIKTIITEQKMQHPHFSTCYSLITKTFHDIKEYCTCIFSVSLTDGCYVWNRFYFAFLDTTAFGVIREVPGLFMNKN